MTDNEKKRIPVEIYNRTYHVIGTESERHVQLVASLVDQKMNEIHDVNKQLDTASLAVLAAVNTMNDYVKLKEDYATLLGSLKKKEE
ncbi:cell division protein ZapA [Oceanobacillus locisalsi]|uniref:Cell division protein ZapA n=1 Tax=Oceanobacillus locisalsi TaxID=546107 RepID=A0ABW3NKD0_9BACI